MTFKHLSKSLDRKIMTTFTEEDAFYAGQPVDAILEKGIERENAYGEVYTPQFEIVSNNEEVTPRVGEAFTIQGEDYIVVAIIENDGNLTTCAVRK